jgi:hypothetical protein
MSNSPSPNLPMRLVVVGAAGRMGKALVRAVSANPAAGSPPPLARGGAAVAGAD